MMKVGACLSNVAGGLRYVRVMRGLVVCIQGYRVYFSWEGKVPRYQAIKNKRIRIGMYKENVDTSIPTQGTYPTQHNSPRVVIWVTMVG